MGDYMAKTLIGNIKGKDGRGITSINKTGTTGPVDTYTITYTDSTTSTFTVNNSDNIALQRQIVPSAAVESSTTASQAYASGDYVVVNGVLRKVKSSIAKGNTISDSNSAATTVSGELATIGDSVSNMMPVREINFTKITSDPDFLVSGVVVGKMATVYCRWVNNGGFRSNAWGRTDLARMDVESAHEGFAIFFDNVQVENQQSRFLYVAGNTICFRTSYDAVIPEKRWHVGSVSFKIK